MRRLVTPLVALIVATGCRDLDRFDTGDGEAYCGSIVAAPFVRTSERHGGFRQDMRLRLKLDVDNLATRPGTLTSDDRESGPCAPLPTFDDAALEAIPELSHDELSLMNFGDGRDHNVMAWAESTCRGPVMTVVSLMRNNRVEVRLLKPAPAMPEATSETRASFALFPLSRRPDNCGF